MYTKGMTNKETTQGKTKMINDNSTLARIDTRTVVIMDVDDGIATVRFACETHTFKIPLDLLEEFW